MNNYPLLANQLPQRIKNVWRNTLFIHSVLLLVAGSFIVLTIRFSGVQFIRSALMAVFLFAVVAVQFLIRGALIPYRYAFHRYEINPEEIAFQSGYFFRSTTYVPIVRIQHVETEQGPLLRHEQLMSLLIHTAATTHHIDGLEIEDAQKLRDQIIELVKAAKEDV